MFKKQSRQPFQKFSGNDNSSKLHYTKKRNINRDLISIIANDYYTQIFPHLKGKTGWQKVQCIFHDDDTPSLSLSLTHGGFFCFGCNASGDLVKFHMLKQHKTFCETIDDFDAWER
jgi:CHC2 zinc finger